MNVVYCQNCGGYTPEGYILCPTCMREDGADEKDVISVMKLLEIINILNMGNTGKALRLGIESIINIAERREGGIQICTKVNQNY
jgi:RNA polymerase subunit RPABC4/transcription elongation factor Spt4